MSKRRFRTFNNSNCPSKDAIRLEFAEIKTTNCGILLLDRGDCSAIKELIKNKIDPGEVVLVELSGETYLQQYCELKKLNISLNQHIHRDIFKHLQETKNIYGKIWLDLQQNKIHDKELDILCDYIRANKHIHLFVTLTRRGVKKEDGEYIINILRSRLCSVGLYAREIHHYIRGEKGSQLVNIIFVPYEIKNDDIKYTPKEIIQCTSTGKIYVSWIYSDELTLEDEDSEAVQTLLLEGRAIKRQRIE